MSGGAIIELHDEVTNLTIVEQVVELIEIADFATVTDKIPASLATAEGQLPISLAAASWDKVTAPTASDLLLTSDTTVSGKVKWAPPAGATISVTVHNSDSVTLNIGDIVIFDPTYTSGLGVKTTTNANDYRACGVIIGANIAAGGSGTMVIGGIQNINVTGAVIFGHSLVASATAHYAQDSGGGGTGPGVIGWALAAQASGNGTISAYIVPKPQYYALATTFIRAQTNTSVPAGAGVTVISSAISDGTNRLMLLWGYNNNTINTLAFNAGSFTNFQTGASNVAYFGYLLASAATANITGTYTTNIGIAIEIFLNGVNTGAPVGTYANASATSVNVSVTIACSPGDLVIAGAYVSSATISGRGAGQTELANISGGGGPWRLVVDSAIATGANITFTWTLSSSMLWDACGVAVKSA